MQGGQYYNRQFSTSSASNSVDTAGDEMVDSGVIFITSAGNNNQRLGIGNDDPHINDYLTSLNGGDSRTGFPSASQVVLNQWGMYNGYILKEMDLIL